MGHSDARNILLQALQRRAGFDPEFVDERPARLGVGIESVCLTIRPVEREHLLGP